MPVCMQICVCSCVYADVCMQLCVCRCVYSVVCMQMCVCSCVYADVCYAVEVKWQSSREPTLRSQLNSLCEKSFSYKSVLDEISVYIVYI